jgi:hypothetical protein
LIFLSQATLQDLTYQTLGFSIWLFMIQGAERQGESQELAERVREFTDFIQHSPGLENQSPLDPTIVSDFLKGVNRYEGNAYGTELTLEWKTQYKNSSKSTYLHLKRGSIRNRETRRPERALAMFLTVNTNPGDSTSVNFVKVMNVKSRGDEYDIPGSAELIFTVNAGRYGEDQVWVDNKGGIWYHGSDVDFSHH